MIETDAIIRPSFRILLWSCSKNGKVVEYVPFLVQNGVEDLLRRTHPYLWQIKRLLGLPVEPKEPVQERLGSGVLLVGQKTRSVTEGKEPGISQLIKSMVVVAEVCVLDIFDGSRTGKGEIESGFS